jgi:hypothetical protein
LRGELVNVATGELYVHLGRRYGNPDQQPPPGTGVVILKARIQRVSDREMAAIKAAVESVAPGCSDS